MSISSFRGLLYGAAKYLGDAQALSKASKTGSVKPIAKRLARRAVGKAAGRAMGKLF